ncbi:MAG TPA: C25 family cysteine peptidase, partial [Bacteroidota bacterium]|nr:C25 family cysteine peptidase [Bacteroidota bacterium]
SNAGKYFILVAATCNYSSFDAINDQSGAELLAAKPRSGAVATLSATRVVFAFQNLGMNNTFFTYLFDQDSAGRMATRRIGDAMYRTKQVRTGTNDRKYFLLGDPALIPAFPGRLAVVDSVNDTPATRVVDLYALGRSSVSASLYPDSLPGTFGGTARLSVYDADRLVTINDPTAGIYVYRANGNILFRGDATVSADRLRADFIVPKDISYGSENGRISLYLWNQLNDGAGFTRNIRIAGTDSTAPADVNGPVMDIYLDSRNFRPGDPVSASPTLIVDITDSSGVNTSGAGIGHRLEAWVDDQPESVDLSDYYRSNPDTYREGVIIYALGAIAPGSHRVRVRAWDTYNNSSTGETVFSVGSGDGLRLMKVYNYPNPFRHTTWFTFEHNQTSPLDVEVRIYTVAGRVINSVSTHGVGDRFVKLPWDGRDRDGDEIANGVYLYKVIARTVDGRYTGEALGKLSINR